MASQSDNGHRLAGLGQHAQVITLSSSPYKYSDIDLDLPCPEPYKNHWYPLTQIRASCRSLTFLDFTGVTLTLYLFK